MEPELANRGTYLYQSGRFSCRWGAHRWPEVSAGPCADSGVNRMAMATIRARVMLSVAITIHKEPRKKPPRGANERNEDPANGGDSSPIGRRQRTRVWTFQQSRMQGVVRTQVAEQRHVIPPPKKTYLRRPDRVKTAHKRQRQAKAKVMLRRSIELSLQQLPESGPGGVSTDKDPGFKKCLRKILGIGKCQLLGHGFQLMY